MSARAGRAAMTGRSERAVHSAEQPADPERYHRRRIGLSFDGPAKPLVKISSSIARGVGSLAVEVLGSARRLVELSRGFSCHARRRCSKKTTPMEGVQCGTKLSNNCLLSMFILTVEDEFLISEYLRAILEGGGHKVIATFGAGEAIEVLERVCDIPLVITDIDMPGSMDGLRLAAAISDRWPPIHLIVVTGFAPPNSYELPRDSLFIPKPYGAAEILSAVRHFQ